MPDTEVLQELKRRCSSHDDAVVASSPPDSEPAGQFWDVPQQGQSPAPCKPRGKTATRVLRGENVSALNETQQHQLVSK